MLHFPTWKILLVAAVCLMGVVFALPNLFSAKTVAEFPDWMPSNQINLGLDLQGGSHLLLEIEVDAVLRERLEAVVEALRLELRRAKVGYTGLGVSNNAVTLGLRNPGDFEAVREAIEELEPEVTVARVGEERVHAIFGEEALRQLRINAVNQSIEIIRRRVDEIGTREPVIQRQGQDRVLVQLPGLKDPERIKALLGRTAKMTFHLVDEKTPVADARRGRMPPGSMLVPSADDVDPQGNPVLYVVRKRVSISGDRLVDAQPSFQQNQPVVSFRFDTLGGKKFGDLTSENVNNRLAILLDGKVISAPVIRSPILGGSGIITGRFTTEEVNDLALLLRAGALPAPMTILEERSVGPSLGADSVRAGEIAGIIAFVAVTIFMIVIYRLFGVMAATALVLNMIIIIGALSLLQATLTLPGLAGIVLTVGMAVDANVLIFERIREEFAGGRTPMSAVDAGYGRALTTIIDSNLTTLIAAMFLFFFGSGPVKGFAVTLSIGIATTMFSAIMVTRFMVVTWLRRTRPVALKI